MNRPILSLLVPLVLASVASQPFPAASADPVHNFLIWADVPDISVMRVGKTYYMSSTTMHLSPGLPIMESTDLVTLGSVSSLLLMVAFAASCVPALRAARVDPVVALREQ